MIKTENLSSLVARKLRRMMKRGQTGMAKEISSMEQEARSLGIKNGEELLATLKSKSRQLTNRARLMCLATEILPEATMFPILAKVLHNERDHELYFQAATGLGGLRSGRAQTELIGMLRHDPRPSSRRLAAYALRFQSKRSEKVRLALLFTAKHDVNTLVRGQAAEALAAGNKKSIPELRILAQDRRAAVRFWSIYALSQLGRGSEVRFLRTLIDDDALPKTTGMDRTVGQEAEWAISQIESRLTIRARKVRRTMSQF